jgi:hypothetical protein
LEVTPYTSPIQVSSLVNIQDWQSQNYNARLADQKLLHDRLDDLDANQNKLSEALSTSVIALICKSLIMDTTNSPDAQRSEMKAMMVSLQKRLDQRLGGDRECQFISHSLEYLYTASGYHVRVENWMITSFDVEFGPVIGEGGL